MVLYQNHRAFLVRPPGLEPGWLPTRPSNVRVCQFRHGRIYLVSLKTTLIIYHIPRKLSSIIFGKIVIFCESKRQPQGFLRLLEVGI